MSGPEPTRPPSAVIRFFSVFFILFLVLLCLSPPAQAEELNRKGGRSAPYHDWQGHPVHPRFALSADFLDFGVLMEGETRELAVTVTNTSPGNIPLFIKLDKGCEGFGLPGVRGKHHLRPGSSLTIPVSFAAGTAGFYECVLDMGNQVPVVPLSAFVMHPDAGFALEPENLEFPEVVIDETATINLKITNTGLTTYTLEPALSGATEVFALRNDLTGYVIPPGGFVFLTVDFTPTAAAGYDAQLYLAYDLPRPLVSGVGVEPILACSMAPASLEFGPIAPGESQTLSLTITNTGNVVLDVSPSIDDPNFSLAGSGASLAPGQALTVPVTFAPLSVGTFTTTIDPGTETCDPVPCVGETTEGGDPTQDNVGFFFDEAMSLTRTTTTAPNEVVMGYLALVNPSNTSGVAGWECWLEMTGNALMLSSVLEGDAINIGGGTQFIVGIGDRAPPLRRRSPAGLLPGLRDGSAGGDRVDRAPSHVCAVAARADVLAVVGRREHTQTDVPPGRSFGRRAHQRGTGRPGRKIRNAGVGHPHRGQCAESLQSQHPDQIRTGSGRTGDAGRVRRDRAARQDAPSGSPRCRAPCGGLARAG